MKNIALLGFGTVGGGVGEILLNNFETIKRRTGLEINVKYILDLREFPDHPLGNRITHDFNDIINDPEVEVVCEMMGGEHPAYDFTLAALNSGKSVVTSNKAVVAEYGVELLEVARRNNVCYMFEASVGGCIPIIRPLSQQAELDGITEIKGILNGTTNYILTKMKDEGCSFESALKDAQALGYAEANPSADVDGFDTCRKICILAAVAFGKLISYKNVKTVGIRSITADDIVAAEKENKTIKLVGHAVKDANGISLTTEPELISNDDILSSVNDVFNAVQIKGEASGELMFYGKGAGKMPTADAVVSDIIEILKNHPAPLCWN